MGVGREPEKRTQEPWWTSQTSRAHSPHPVSLRITRPRSFSRFWGSEKGDVGVEVLSECDPKDAVDQWHHRKVQEPLNSLTSPPSLLYRVLGVSVQEPGADTGSESLGECISVVDDNDKQVNDLVLLT